MGFKSFINTIFSGSATNIITGVGKVFDKCKFTEEERAEYEIEIQKIVTEQIKIAESATETEMMAKSEVIQAEMNQGDKYTKRARPTVVYAGLGLVILNFCILPMLFMVFNKSFTPPEIPSLFWQVWGGVCGLWVLGRSAERIGVGNKLTKITGR